MLYRTQNAVIKGDEDLTPGSFEWSKDRDGGAQGPMHPGGLLVFRRAPHAVVDVRRRRDVGMGEGEAAAALRRRVFGAGKVGHSARLNRFARIASRVVKTGLCHGVADSCLLCFRIDEKIASPTMA